MNQNKDVKTSQRLFRDRFLGGFPCFVWAFFISLSNPVWSNAQSPTTLRFSDIHGQSWSGNLVSLDMENLVYQPSEPAGVPERTLKTDEILKIEMASRSPNRNAEVPALKATTTDGSTFSFRKISGKEKNWSIQVTDNLPPIAFGGELKYLKLRKLDNKAQEAWDAYTREEIKSDALIVVRPGGALDRVDGVIKEIRDDKVIFDVDGQVVEPSFERLAGILWFRKPQDSAKGCLVRLNNESSLVVQKARLDDQNLELEGSWGSPLRIPLEWLESIDCGLDKIAWVSAIAPLESRSLGTGGFGDFDPVLARSFKPRWVKNQDASGEDLLFSGPGEYLMRAPQGMTRFQTRVQRANESEARSAVLIEVWVDDQIAFKQELAPADESLELEVPVSSEKKIKLALRSKSSLNLGTRTLWKQPRFTK